MECHTAKCLQTRRRFSSGNTLPNPGGLLKSKRRKRRHLPRVANTFGFVFYFVKLAQRFTFILCEFNHLNIFFLLLLNGTKGFLCFIWFV